MVVAHRTLPLWYPPLATCDPYSHPVLFSCPRLSALIPVPASFVKGGSAVSPDITRSSASAGGCRRRSLKPPPALHDFNSTNGLHVSTRLVAMACSPSRVKHPES